MKFRMEPKMQSDIYVRRTSLETKIGKVTPVFRYRASTALTEEMLDGNQLHSRGQRYLVPLLRQKPRKPPKISHTASEQAVCKISNGSKILESIFTNKQSIGREGTKERTLKGWEDGGGKGREFQGEED